MHSSQVTWKLDNLETVGGHRVEVLGAPRLLETELGEAMVFDGERDGLIVPAHPLEGASRFTIEAIFRPDTGGLQEQRFMHIQPDADSRMLLETRVSADGGWFMDTFIKCGEAMQTLYAQEWLHPLGRWYHVALIFDGQKMRHLVDGQQEMAQAARYEPTEGGQTSLGVRLNRVSWFRGAMRLLRFTPGVLSPQEFLSVGR